MYDLETAAQDNIIRSLQKIIDSVVQSCILLDCLIITGPPNGPVLFCSLMSVVCRRRLSSSVTLPAGGPAGRPPSGRTHGRSGGRHCTAGM